MTLYDPSEIFRQGIKDWWESQSLSSLGPVAMRDDDGSPASLESSLPNTTIRIGAFDLDRTSNMSTYWAGDFTVEVHHGSAEQASSAINPLDALLEEMIREQSALPAMDRGYLTELRVTRSRLTQIDALLWRADRECSVVLVVDQ